MASLVDDDPRNWAPGILTDREDALARGLTASAAHQMLLLAQRPSQNQGAGVLVPQEEQKSKQFLGTGNAQAMDKCSDHACPVNTEGDGR